MKKQKYIISSTNLDKQGYVMAKSALESMLPNLNGVRKPRLGLEHIRTFPSFGVIMNGEIFKGEDNAYYLSAEMLYFDKNSAIKLDDGTELHKEYFSERNYPFIECEADEVDKLHISTDPANFEKHSDIQEIYDDLVAETGIEFNTSFIGRKSELPDPETIITITKPIAILLGLIASKIPQKLGDVVADDLVKFYKLISKLSLESIKKVKPTNRPKNFVISYPNSECNIELVITTTKADDVLNSLSKEKLAPIADKLFLLKNLTPEKIQFIYNDKKEWEFNYLLSKDGSVIGTKKSFKKRDELYNEILVKQNLLDNNLNLN